MSLRLRGFLRKVNPKNCGSGAAKDRQNLKTERGESHITLDLRFHVTKNTKSFGHFIIPDEQGKTASKPVGLSQVSLQCHGPQVRDSTDSCRADSLKSR